ncbi:type II secretion system protein N [Hyphomonas atlantica]|uniref:type II secretion system protein N n=1 Tax=Hyphomonas atlantica TaxID=1280948 RepID=UPI003516F5D2
MNDRGKWVELSVERFESLAKIARQGASPALRAIEAVLVIGLGLSAAKLAWLAIEPGGAVSPDIPVRASVRGPMVTTSAISVDTSRLIHENPFGAGAAILADTPDAPETSLNLRLRGVRASSDEADGIAWITTPNNETAAYRPGEVILDGVTLHRIYADRVTLRKAGQTEALLMEGGAGLLSVLTTPGSNEARDGLSPNTTTSRVARADLVSSITIDPVHRGTDFVGYRIGSRGDETVLIQAGLRPGDVVIGLDGAAITDVPPAELARKFSDPAPVRLTLDRDGQTFDHTLAPEEARSR